MGLADYFGNKRKDTSLINAIKASNLAGFRNLIKEKVDINKSGKNRNTPLHHATTLEDSSFVNELLAAGADSFKVNEKGETALHYALKLNKKQPNIQVIKKLIEFSKTFNKLDNDYYSPLYLLLSHSLINNFRENLKDIFSKSNDQIEGNKTKILSAGKTLLHSAASNYIISKETFKIILDECNLDINVVDSEGYTPLYYAIMSNNQSIIDLMLEEKTLDLKSGYGTNYLKAALFKNNLDCITKLIKKGAVPDFHLTRSEIEDYVLKTEDDIAHLGYITEGDTLLHFLIKNSSIATDEKTKLSNSYLPNPSNKHLKLAKICIDNFPKAIDLENSKGKTASYYAVCLVSPISARLLSSDFASNSKRIEKLVCKGYSRNFTSKENLQALASNGVITEAQRKAGDNYRERLEGKSESFIEQIKQEKSQIKEKQNTL